MKLTTFLAYALLVVSGGGVTNALSLIAPVGENCGNGIFCAPSQTCMSNASALGAGLVYACSPLPNAVRCMDARFSCPALSSCAEGVKCIYPSSKLTDAVVNVDAFRVAKFRDFGSGLKSTALSICGPITGTFRLPNFCTCKDAKFGGELGCTIGLQNYISIGASAWVLPCASPANFGYKAWASLVGITASVGKTWTASFSTNIPIPGASFEIGVANVGARAMISGEVSQFIISTNLAIGVCAKVNIGVFSKQICNPSALRWLPVNILTGPRFDFSRFCL